MGVFAQLFAPVRFPFRSRGRAGSPLAALLSLLLFLLLTTLLVPGSAASAAAAPGIQHWSVSDALGHGWGLSLFEQPDPDFAPGWRLRLNARTPGLTLDHERPLAIGDGLGGAWELANRSEELVARGVRIVPAGSAQFDVADLEPRPRDSLPLRLTLPLADGTATALTLGPEVVAALHALPSREPTGPRPLP
jgi:hypothetical protein